MNWLFENYLKLYSFYLSTNKRTANGTYKAFAKNLSYSNCFITIFGTISTTCFLFIYITGIDVEDSTLNMVLVLSAISTSVLAFNFRTKYSKTISELDEHPEELTLDTLTLNVIQVSSMAIPYIAMILLYPLILGQPINW